jgi:hypothetical protein
VRHRRQLAAHCLDGEHETSVDHAQDHAIAEGCRSTNFQRTANSGLTENLSRGAHPSGGSSTSAR